MTDPKREAIVHRLIGTAAFIALMWCVGCVMFYLLVTAYVNAALFVVMAAGNFWTLRASRRDLRRIARERTEHPGGAFGW